MSEQLFPEIVLRKEFANFAEHPYLRAIRFIRGEDPSYKKEYRNAEAQTILKYKQFCAVVKILKDEGLKFVPIKGFYLFNALFFDYPGIRRTADIDLFFHKDDFKKAARFLKKRRDFYICPTRHDIVKRYFGEKIHDALSALRSSFLFRNFFGDEDFAAIFNGVLIEFHRKISHFFFSEMAEDLFKNRQKIKNPDGMELELPTIEFSALTMLLHDYKNQDFPELSFRRIIEFYIVLRQCDFNKLKKAALKYGLEKMLDCHLFLIYTIVENSSVKRDSFKILKEFGYIKIDGKSTKLRVSKPEKLFKSLYGKRRYYFMKAMHCLRPARNLFHFIFARNEEVRKRF